MSKTLSTMLPLGTRAPAFTLPNPSDDNSLVSLDSYSNAPGYLVMFICNHCPFVLHVCENLVRLCKEIQDQGFVVFAINPNDVERYPADSPAKMVDFALKHHFTFPYLFDEGQKVALAYQAACTPDFFLFNREKKLVYRGQMDDSRPGNAEANDGRDLRAAVAAALHGKEPLLEQRPSMGCNIKWKPGNEPTYFRV